jgi:hypothetical protein
MRRVGEPHFYLMSADRQVAQRKLVTQKLRLRWHLPVRIVWLRYAEDHNAGVDEPHVGKHFSNGEIKPHGIHAGRVADFRRQVSRERANERGALHYGDLHRVGAFGRSDRIQRNRNAAAVRPEALEIGFERVNGDELCLPNVAKSHKQ